MADKKSNNSLLNRIKANKAIMIIVMIFLVSFIFYFLFSMSIPQYWEDYGFHTKYSTNSSYTALIKETFTFTESNIFDLRRPVYGLLFRVEFDLFGHNYPMYRLVKIIISSVMFVVSFLFLRKYFNKYKYLLPLMALIIFSYPVYSNFTQYDAPFAITELFLLLSLYFFLKDFNLKETSKTNQILAFFFAILTIRSYNQGLILVPILFLFTLFSDYKKFRRYFLFFILLAIFVFPLNLFSLDPGDYGGGVNLYSFKSIVVKDASYFLGTPVPYTGSIYYMPIYGTISFFGLWFLILITLFMIGKKTIREKYPFLLSKRAAKSAKSNKSLRSAKSSRELLILCGVWIASVIPLWILAPDPTVRYQADIFIPLAALFIIYSRKFIESFSKKFLRKAYVFFLIVIILIAATNISYVYLFKITWGNHFVAIEKSKDYIESIRKPGAVILYEGPVARLYHPINTSDKERFDTKKDVLYFKTMGREAFIEMYEEHIYNFTHNISDYSELYVVKRESAFGRTLTPDIDFDKDQRLSLLRKFNGFSNDTVDIFTYLISPALEKVVGREYTFNKVYVYKLEI